MYVIVAYDCDQKRVAKALKICRKYLFSVQRSLFEGEISAAKLKKLQQELQEVITETDSLVIYTFETNKLMKRTYIGTEKHPIQFIF